MYKLFKTRRKIVLGGLCLVFAGCSLTPYRYNFSLIEPQNEEMSFEDENIKFKFVPSSENIKMTINNKTDHKIDFVRDKAEYIDFSGKSHNVHYGNDYVQEAANYEKNNMYVPVIKIDQDSDVTGNVWINIWPKYNIAQGRHAITMDEIHYLREPLFPRNISDGDIKDLKGSTFYLILPIDFGDNIRNYKFTFMINDVVE